MAKRIETYTGDEKYIFISYSHRDSDTVVKIIERLVNDGYRVWYDDGITPGSEWDENIAEHVKRCGLMLAMISENYINSSNCKDELNYARDLDKDRLLIYLEETNLPAGMAMRLGRLQAIYYSSYPDFEDFIRKLYAAKELKNYCSQPIVKNAPDNAKQPIINTASNSVNGEGTEPVTGEQKTDASGTASVSENDVAGNSAKDSAGKNFSFKGINVNVTTNNGTDRKWNFTIPGFRSKILWKEITAGIIYGGMGLFLLILLMANSYQFIECFVLFLGIVIIGWFTFDYLNVQEKLGLRKIKSRVGRGLMVAFIDLVLFTVLITIFCKVAGISVL